MLLKATVATFRLHHGAKYTPNLPLNISAQGMMIAFNSFGIVAGIDVKVSRTFGHGPWQEVYRNITFPYASPALQLIPEIYSKLKESNIRISIDVLFRENVQLGGKFSLAFQNHQSSELHLWNVTESELISTLESLPSSGAVSVKKVDGDNWTELKISLWSLWINIHAQVSQSLLTPIALD